MITINRPRYLLDTAASDTSSYSRKHQRGSFRGTRAAPQSCGKSCCTGGIQEAVTPVSSMLFFKIPHASQPAEAAEQTVQTTTHRDTKSHSTAVVPSESPKAAAHFPPVCVCISHQSTGPQGTKPNRGHILFAKLQAAQATPPTDQSSFVCATGPAYGRSLTSRMKSSLVSLWRRCNWTGPKGKGDAAGQRWLHPAPKTGAKRHREGRGASQGSLSPVARAGHLIPEMFWAWRRKKNAGCITASTQLPELWTLMIQFLEEHL